MSTNSSCSNFPAINITYKLDDQTYSVTERTPNCLATMSDLSYITYFDGVTGAVGCGSQSSYTNKLKPVVSDPIHCKPQIASWTSFDLKTADCTYSDATITFYDPASGLVVPGFSAVAVSGTTPASVSLAGFPASINSLRFEIKMTVTAGATPACAGLPTYCPISYEAVCGCFLLEPR